MKKLLKQLLAVTTAIMMAITLLPAMANADETTGTTINGNQQCQLIIEKKDKKNQNKGVPGAIFTAYKVAELTTNTNGTYNSFQLIEPFSNDASLNNITKDNLNNLSTKELEEKATKVREVAQAEGNAETVISQNATTGSDGKATMDLGIGYYLVVETKVPTGYVASKPFFVAMPTPSTTTKDGKTTTTGWTTKLTVQPKNEQVNSPEKTADEETVGTNGEITYTIKGSTVAEYDAADGYDVDSLKYWISDKFPDGFSLKENTVKVYPDNPTNKDVQALDTSKYTLLTNLNLDTLSDEQKAELGANTLLVKFEGSQVTEQKGKTIYVQYTAVADNPNPQNKNSATVIFTNDPNGGVATPKTDKTVSSFKIQVMKTGEKDSKPLAEATFKLLNEAGEELGTGTSGADGIVTFKKDNKNIMVSKGTYYLEETEAPSGYSLLNSKVKVVIGKENNAEDKVVFYYNVNNNKEKTLIPTEGEDNGVVEVSITNKKGFNLPSTGGMGTYIFTIGGLVVMAGAVLLLVSSKKKRA